MAHRPQNPAFLRVAELAAGRPVAFDLCPAAPELARLAAELGLLGLRKLRFAGTLSPEGRSDWRLEARLGATVVQPCVVTLEPVTTRIDEAVTRRFLRAPPQVATAAGESETPEDDSIEPLGESIDIAAVMTEALTLALPDYPRAEGAGPGPATVAPPGAAPLTEVVARPFAGLADLKRRLEDGD